MLSANVAALIINEQVKPLDMSNSARLWPDDSTSTTSLKKTTPVTLKPLIPPVCSPPG
jgi:hypothetical protein